MWKLPSYPIQIGWPISRPAFWAGPWWCRWYIFGREPIQRPAIRRRVLDDAYDNSGYLNYGYAIEDLPWSAGREHVWKWCNSPNPSVNTNCWFTAIRRGIILPIAAPSIIMNSTIKWMCYCRLGFDLHWVIVIMLFNTKMRVWEVVWRWPVFQLQYLR